MSYNFKDEFNKIDFFIENELYREAGYECGYMLEYMMREIYDSVRGRADPNLIVNTFVPAEIEIGKGANPNYRTFELGRLIQLQIKLEFIHKAKNILNIDNCHSKNIPFSDLNKIRNQCAHPKDVQDLDPTKDTIKKFKNSLKNLSKEFKIIFHDKTINKDFFINSYQDVNKLRNKIESRDKIIDDLKKEITFLKQNKSSHKSVIKKQNKITDYCEKSATNKYNNEKIKYYISLFLIAILAFISGLFLNHNENENTQKTINDEAGKSEGYDDLNFIKISCENNSNYCESFMIMKYQVSIKQWNVIMKTNNKNNQNYENKAISNIKYNEAEDFSKIVGARICSIDEWKIAHDHIDKEKFMTRQIFATDGVNFVAVVSDIKNTNTKLVQNKDFYTTSGFIGMHNVGIRLCKDK